MAEVTTYWAYVSVKDSAKKLTRVAMRVSQTDAQAYVAAADEAARDATKVGLLIDSVANLTLTGPLNYYAKGLDTENLNDGFVQPAGNAGVYNSNKLNVAYQTNIGGTPKNRQFTIPQRDPTTFATESNGINVNIGAGASAEIQDLIVQVADTLLGIDLQAAAVLEITVNDQ